MAEQSASTPKRVRTRHFQNAKETGIKITGQQMAALNLHRHDFHGNWNYTIKPTKPADS